MRQKVCTIVEIKSNISSCWIEQLWIHEWIVRLIDFDTHVCLLYSTRKTKPPYAEALWDENVYVSHETALYTLRFGIVITVTS